MVVESEVLGLVFRQRFRISGVTLRCSPPAGYARGSSLVAVVEVEPTEVSVRVGEQFTIRLTLKILEDGVKVRRAVASVSLAYHVITDVIQPEHPTKGSLAWMTLGFTARAEGTCQLGAIEVVYDLGGRRFIARVELLAPSRGLREGLGGSLTPLSSRSSVRVLAQPPSTTLLWYLNPWSLFR